MTDTPSPEAAPIVTQGMRMTPAPGWHDRSALVLSSDRAGPSGMVPNLVVTRDVVDDPLSDPVAGLEAFVDLQLGRMRAGLTGMKEVSRRHCAGPGSPAELRIEWVADGVRIAQWITYVRLDERTVMVATGTAGQEDIGAVEPDFRAMLKSFRMS